ncbi:hypothetical protein PWG71_21360 [Nocardiopsis sp. N85]|uniref:hypothetical protein n=1 Tax=Nocardiopsis sp. N85 TaxID=3029400 RepID=UPI00237F5D01|nr:hypothetical protein [Nocardiopsis sp. N85]MDE3723947.1 hypothetical protein [Nocardiopsis sp. N85]
MRIAVEGIDGIGKSTALSYLRDRLATDRSLLTTTMAPITLELMKRFGRDVYGAEQAY